MGGRPKGLNLDGGSIVNVRDDVDEQKRLLDPLKNSHSALEGEGTGCKRGEGKLPLMKDGQWIITGPPAAESGSMSTGRRDKPTVASALIAMPVSFLAVGFRISASLKE